MNRKSIIVSVFLLIIMLLCSSVYAVFDADFQLKYDKQTVKAGDTIKVTLKVLNITGTEKGVENIEGYINVDKNIIEPITVDNIEKDENGKVVIGDMKLNIQDLTNATNTDSIQENGIVFNGKPLSGNDAKIIMDFPKPLTTDTETLTMNFKVKEDAKIGKVEKAIQYNMFVMYSGEEKTVSATGSLDITVEESEHNWVVDTEKSKAATCEEDGYTYYVCSICGKTKTEVIKATGHKFGDWKVVKEATTTSEGQKQRTCSVCGEVETQTISKLKDTNTNTNNTNNNTNTNNVTNNVVNNTNTNTNKNNNTNGNNTVKNNTTNNAGNSANTTDKTTSNKVLPAAGAVNLIIPAIVLIAIAYACYNKYIKYKDI